MGGGHHPVLLGRCTSEPLARSKRQHNPSHTARWVGGGFTHSLITFVHAIHAHRIITHHITHTLILVLWPSLSTTKRRYVSEPHG